MLTLWQHFSHGETLLSGLHLYIVLAPFSHFFSISSVTNTRGHTAKLIKSRYQLDTRRVFFSESFIDRWNCLDQEAIDSSTVNSFKNSLESIRKTRMGSLWIHGHMMATSALNFSAGAAAPGKLLVVDADESSPV